MRLQVFGVEDDMICVEEVDENGAGVPDGFYAEFESRYGDIVDEPNYLGFSDGTLLRISFDGQWHIVALEVGSCKATHSAARNVDEDYTDTMTLECVDGFSWIVEGKDMARLPGRLDFFVS